MTSKRDDFSVSRPELVVLARHSSSKPPGEGELVEVMKKLVFSADHQAHAKTMTKEIVEALRKRGMLTPPKRTSSRLTEAGGQVLCQVFSLPRTPTWEDVRNKHLPALGLKLQPGSAEATRIWGRGGDPSVEILRAHFGLTRGTSLTDVCNTLLLEELKLAVPKAPITLAWLRTQILARRAGAEPNGKPQELAKRLVAKLLHVPKANKKDLSLALGRRWVMNQSVHPSEEVLGGGDPGNGLKKPAKPPEKNSQPPPDKNTQVHSSDLLLKVVREALPRVGADGRFGTEKVFVSAIWRGIERDDRVSPLSYDHFKKWLVRANREGQLILVRADLVASMNPKLVADSTIEDHGTTFHFVLDRRTSSDPERRSHAR